MTIPAQDGVPRGRAARKRVVIYLMAGAATPELALAAVEGGQMQRATGPAGEPRPVEEDARPVHHPSAASVRRRENAGLGGLVVVLLHDSARAFHGLRLGVRRPPAYRAPRRRHAQRLQAWQALLRGDGLARCGP